MENIDVTETVRQMLIEEFGLDEGLKPDTLLFSSNLLDSLNSIEVISLVEAKMGVRISPLDVSLDDFDSVERITATINRLK
ncbi:MAG: acyl carrier protein [Litorimonas sp.]